MPHHPHLPLRNTLPPRAGWWATLALVWVAAALWAAPAAAWVQYRSAGGCGVRWWSPTGTADGPVAVTLATDSRGLPGASATDLQDTVAWAAAQWQQVQCAAGDVTAPDAVASQPLGVTFQLSGLQPVAPIGACKARNPDGSCLSVQPNGNYITVIDQPSEWIYGSFLYGLTVLTFRDSDGEIVDGDILLNESQYDFCAGQCATGTTPLCNTLTHEVGHLLGLDHSAVATSTMFTNAGPNEVQKCTLHGDDEQGICWAYRHDCSAPAVTADPSDGGSTDTATDDGCGASRSANHGAGKSSAAALLGLFLLCWSLYRCASTSCTART